MDVLTSHVYCGVCFMSKFRQFGKRQTPWNRCMWTAMNACRIFKHDTRTSEFDASRADSDIQRLSESTHQVMRRRRPSSTTTDRRASNHHRLPMKSPRYYRRVCYQSSLGSIGVNILTASIVRNIIDFAPPPLSAHLLRDGLALPRHGVYALSEHNHTVHGIQDSVWCSSIYLICMSRWVFDVTARRARV